MEQLGGSKPSPSLPLRGAEPGPAGRVELERLEYGKFCVVPDGPIEPGSEAYALVRSPGFPASLEPLCHPATIGVGSDLPSGVEEGWVVRSVRHSGGVMPVACRLQRRPEDGKGGVRRRYWLGRYLCCPGSSVDPLTCFLALRSEGLRGITAAEAQSAWDPIRVERGRPPAVSPLLRDFLRQAVVYAISAVPIGLAPRISEPELFAWASALWALLPPALRPVFAAGWGVAPSESPSLNLSFAPVYSPAVAVFDLQTGSWRPPSERLTLPADGREKTGPLRDKDLTPGRMYLREAFTWGADGQPNLDSLQPRVEHLADLDPGLRGANPPQVVDLRTPWAVDVFNRPGLRSLDHARFQVLERWIEGPAVPAPPGLCLAASDYFTAGARQQVLALGLRALERADVRGDRVVWASLRDDSVDWDRVGRGGWSEAVRTRVRLLRELARGEAGAALAALTEAAAAGAAHSLPEEAERRLAACLAGSLERTDLLDRHVRILQQPSLPELYRRWAGQQARPLSLALARRSGGLAPLRRLAGLTADPFVSAVANWREGLPPREADARALEGVGEELRRELARQLVAEWSALPAEGRENLLAWLSLVPPQDLGEERDPLLRIWREGADLALSSEERPRLAAAIQTGHVPPSLEPRVAAVVLSSWYFLSEDFSPSEGWTGIVSHWPFDVRLALINDQRNLPARPALPEVQEALERFSLPSERLDRILNGHRRGSPDVICRVAPLLWEWCQRTTTGPQVFAPDLCRALSKGELPRWRVSPETAFRAAYLTRHQGFFRSRLDRLNHLWARAAEPWQIFLLLASAPEADLEPHPEQLEVLVRHREELARHLQAVSKTNPKREKRFRIASLDFHSEDFPRNGGGDWQLKYGQSFVWAAYRRVPFSKQGDLGKALNEYATDLNSPDQFNQRRMKLAQIYLAQYRKPAERAEAVRRIAGWLVHLMEEELAIDRRTFVQVVRAVFAERANAKVSSPAYVVERPDDINLLERGRKEFRIAPWFKSFLLQLHDWGDGDDLLAALESSGGSA